MFASVKLHLPRLNGISSQADRKPDFRERRAGSCVSFAIAGGSQATPEKKKKKILWGSTRTSRREISPST